MKYRLAGFVLAFLASTSVLAASSGIALDSAPINLDDKASLQRGARLFVNYCMGCHSAQYQRYNRLAKDLGLTDQEVTDNLIFTRGTKVGDTMEVAMKTEDARRWFGAAPPDLTLVARSKGSDYLYTFLRSFYLDKSRPMGVNNAAFPAVGMPHVLWSLQGWQEAVVESTTDELGNKHEAIAELVLVEPGNMSKREYDAAIADLVNFMTYISEPIQQERKRIGWWVLAFLLLSLLVFYPLKKEYWKDVHHH